MAHKQYNTILIFMQHFFGTFQFFIIVMSHFFGIIVIKEGEIMAKIDMMLYKEIGKILKRERLHKEISLDQLVDKINGIKTKSTLKRYEDGKSRIDMDILPIVCEALNINYVDVIKEAENEVNFHNSKNTSLGDYNENVEYLKDKPELLELYKEIVANDQLVLLFDKARKLSPQDLEQILKIIDTFNKETM